MSNFFNNGQRMPNIFERASACDNWNEGNFQPQEDGYEDKYYKLTDDEKSLVFRHPGYAFKFNANAEKAKKVGRNLDGTVNGYGDAVRHCYWCALNQVSAGLNSSLAEEFGNAHENTPTNTEKEKRMDLHNNAVGYYLGNQAIINDWSEEELLNKVIDAANNGKLKIGL